MKNEPSEKNHRSRSSAGEARAIRAINRVLLFILVTAILVVLLGFAVEYVCVRGPSEHLRDSFVLTMQETRRFGFLSRVFLSAGELDEILSKQQVEETVEQDLSLISIPDPAQPQQAEQPPVLSEAPVYGTVDEDGDGIIVEEIQRKGFRGIMIVVLDPARVFVGKPDYYSEDAVGLTVEQMCRKYEALGGINGGGFYDAGGLGNGGMPTGLTVCGGSYYNTDAEPEIFIGFDYDGILHVGRMDAYSARQANIRDGVTFDNGPILVANGEATAAARAPSGINPRTAIGQRADGAVLLLVVDGRQATSAGCYYSDLADIMLDYGAVNACNLDGGSSSVMWYDGDYINEPCAMPRPLPSGFLFR